MREPGAHDVTDPAVGGMGTAAGGGDLVGAGSSATRRPGRREPPLDLARDLPRAARAGARAPLDDHLREQPPRRRAAGGAAERAGCEREARRGRRRRRDRRTTRVEIAAPTTARSRARSGWWSRSCSSPASCRAWSPPRRSSSASTWARSTSCSRSSRRSRSPPASSGSAAPATASARSRRAGSSPSSAPTCSSARSSSSGCATARSRRPWCRATRSTCSRSRSSRWPPTTTGACRSCTTWSSRAYPYGDLSRELLDSVLDMLDGRYPSEEFAELRPRIVWDRVEDTIRARKGARQLAVTNAGTIPDRGLFGVHLPDGRRVGELDEEMVYEARPGQTFLLGASTWRIEEITRDRVIVTPAPGAPGALPFWRGDGVGRPLELGRAIGEFSRWAVDQEPGGAREAGTTSTSAPRATSSPTCASSRRRRASCRPTARSWSSASATRSATGGCACSPPSAAACTPPGRWRWRARIRDELRASSPTRSGPTTGSSSTSPTPTSRPAPSSCWSTRTSSRSWSSRELSGSALFGARFRENAARALLLPRAYPGKRTPLWQQRLKAQSLLEVAKRYGQFPIVLETYRECLRDVFDLPALDDLLRKLHRARAVAGRGRDPARLAVRLVAAVRLRRDVHVRGRHAERRAARGGAVARPRPAARAARPGGAARADRPRRAGRGRGRPPAAQRTDAGGERRLAARRAARARRPDARRGAGALPRRGVGGADARPSSSASGARSRCRIGGERRYLAAEDAGLYRDAFGAVPPGGLPETFLEHVEEPLARLVRRYARTHGPFTTAELARALRVDLAAGAARARARRRPRPRRAAARAARSASGATRRCCGGCGGRRSRRCARRSSRPSSARWRASCRRGRGSTPRRRAAPGSTACASCWSRSRGSRSRPRSGSATCCRAAPAPTRPPGSTSSAPAASWSGSAPDRSGARAAAWRSTSATTRAGSARRRSRASGPRSRTTTCCASGSPRARRSGPTCWRTSAGSSPPSCRRRSGTSSGRAR